MTVIPIVIGIIVTFMFHSFSQFPSKVEVLIPLFTFFQFYSVVSRDSKVHNSASSLFYVYNVWSSGRDLVIRLYLKISEVFVRLTLQDRFWIVHILFVRMVKIKFFAQFSVDNLANPVLPCLVLFLC